MNETHVKKISSELDLAGKQVASTVALLDEGSTVPFIARYRKEVTGGLDEVAITAIRDRVEQLAELDKRREAILKSLDEQGKLSDELKKKVNAAETMATLEDIYLPYRPKRRTRGMMAIEKGLQPLAETIFEQGDVDPAAEAEKFVDPEKEVESAEDALKGARDIIAEWINEDADLRSQMRELFEERAVLSSKVVTGKEEEGAKYKDYFEWDEPAKDAPSHRILAVRRGAKEGILMFRVQPEAEEGIRLIERKFVNGSGSAAEQVRQAGEDCYKRLLSLSMETEMRLELKKRADEKAISVFAENLRELLLASPLGQKAILALDPGLRTGCKLVVLDKQGKLLLNDTIYPLPPRKETDVAEAKLKLLCERFDVEAIAVGNGTGGREAQAFCESCDLGKKIPVILVNESGASVYSASEVAREEFPDYDLTVRGAVSIGRRLCDPLAELVKIDPKSIGVGQYQHDVDQSTLKRALDDTVVSCVNNVGVEINTASKQLLSYVSGLGPVLAGNIVTYRDVNGAFVSRKQLLEVPRLGPKAFEQAAGFLRVRGGQNPLDASAVHPESYRIVEKMAADLGCSVNDLIADAGLRQRIKLENYVTDTVGMPTLKDILSELAKPGRDPRKQFEVFQFAEGVNKMTDLQPGMKLPGIVTNVTAFGAFVDVGVHQDGLVHISELADEFVKDPADVVKVQQQVQVTVLDVDLDRKRISLSMKTNPGQKPKRGGGKPKGRGGKKQGSRGGGKPRQQSRPAGETPFAGLLKDFKPKKK
ncbi:MAG: Tex family protein [Phycisphaerae bacterium]